MDNAARPGARLKAIRVEKGLTLADVAEKTGFTASTLSKMEREKISMSYDTLEKLCSALDVDIAMFFTQGPEHGQPAFASGRRSFNRADEGQQIETGSYRHLYKATDLVRKRFIPVVADIKAHSLEEFGEMIRHSGEEYVYVLDGTVDLHTEFYTPLRLEVGDSVYFDSGMKHAYIAVGDKPCRILCICSGTETQIIGAMSKTESRGQNAAMAEGAMPAWVKAALR